jgi:glucose/mannose transport system substrate-binding protein
MKVLRLWVAACLAWTGLLPGLQAIAAAHAQPASLDVLHWWTSASERHAADQLSALLAPAGVQWNDAAIPGGGGMAAVKVLKSRVLMGDPPDVAQLIGSTLTEWADKGLVLPLNALATRQKWSQFLFPTVMELISYQGDVVAAPLGIHRINTLLYNRHLFAKLGLQPPRTWAEFESASRKFSVAGIKPLAWSEEAWQIATVFESLLLGEAGPALYQDLIVLRKSAAWMDPRVAKALQRLRWLRTLSGRALTETAWTASAREVMHGTAAMVIMGDWAKGELVAWGANAQSDFGCIAVPGTARMHLYSVDTLAMLVNGHHPVALQEKMAETVVGMPAQLAYNRIKGSVPVRQDLSPAALSSMDSCARDSWETFASSATDRVPSLAHRMAADEATKDAVAQALWRFLADPRMDTVDAQRRLASVMRAP